MEKFFPREYPYPIPKPLLLKKLLNFLEIDIASGDLSTGLIPPNVTRTAKIRSKSSGVVAGLYEVSLLFEEIGVEVKTEFKDGMQIKEGEELIEISGNLRDILMLERTVLDILMKLSSIATSTNDYVKKIQLVNNDVILAATRKVTPGFGWFEKKAVYYGGGDPHRWNLSDMVMFKDTHRAFYQGNIKKLIHEARNQISFSKKIELEIENIQDLSTAIEAGVDIIMFDNFSPTEIQKGLASLDKYPSHILFEASGNITLENIQEYAATGVHIISTSSPIMHPHHFIDYSLRLQ